MAVIAYLRVSSDEQAESGLGLDAQLHSIVSSIGAPESVFSDEGISGRNPKRPGLLAALETLRKGDTLAVAKRDRLARDTYLSLWIEKETKKRGARIVSAAGEGTESDDPAAVLMRTLIDAFAAYEANIGAMRTRAALGAKKRRGEKLGGITPFGFQAVPDASKSVLKLVPNDNELFPLRLIKEAHNEGKSLREICSLLECKGIKTKTGKSKWQAKTVANIIARVC